MKRVGVGDSCWLFCERKEGKEFSVVYWYYGQFFSFFFVMCLASLF